MTTISVTAAKPLLCFENCPILSTKSFNVAISSQSLPVQNQKRLHSMRTAVCHAARRKPTVAADDASKRYVGGNDSVRRVLQILLWAAEAVYILWLFLLPYAPGDPVWAISSETINSLFGLSLNFFFILPLMNSGPFQFVIWDIGNPLLWLFPELILFNRTEVDLFFIMECWDNTLSCSILHNCCNELFGRVVGIRLIDAPLLHPMSEGLFNFIIGWTFMFAPLLFTDRRRDRYKGSLDILWGLQMFLTNAFLIPYMAIRLNEADSEDTPRNRSQLGSVMANGAPVVGLIGGAVCLISTLWALYGRMDGDFGGITERWEFLVSYLGSERLAYAFIWDIFLYIIFQPWLIGDNLQNVQLSKVGILNYLRFVPVIGLVGYLLFLNLDEEQ